MHLWAYTLDQAMAPIFRWQKRTPLLETCEICAKNPSHAAVTVHSQQWTTLSFLESRPLYQF